MKVNLFRFTLGVLFFAYCVIPGQAFANTEKDFRIAHAKADVEYYKARKATAEVVLKKAQRQLIRDNQHLRRMEILLPSKAITEEELEDAQNQAEQTALNISLMESRIIEAEAEIKQAEASLEIAKLAKNPPALVDLKAMRNPRYRRGSFQDDNEQLENLMQWKIMGFDDPEDLPRKN